MPSERPRRTEQVLLWIVLFLVFPPLLLALFGLLAYPAIFEHLRNWVQLSA